MSSCTHRWSPRRRVQTSRNPAFKSAKGTADASSSNSPFRFRSEPFLLGRISPFCASCAGDIRTTTASDPACSGSETAFDPCSTFFRRRRTCISISTSAIYPRCDTASRYLSRRLLVWTTRLGLGPIQATSECEREQRPTSRARFRRRRHPFTHHLRFSSPSRSSPHKLPPHLLAPPLARPLPTVSHRRLPRRSRLGPVSQMAQTVLALRRVRDDVDAESVG